MGSYLLRRVIIFIPTLLIVSFLIYSMIHLVPGDPTALMLGQEATADQAEQLREQLGLNRSFMEQAVSWYGNALTGDLGTSFFLKSSVMDAVKARIPITASLTILALVIAMTIGVSAGIIASVKHGRFADWGIMLLAVLGFSIPVFWLALNLIFVFSVRLGWFPTGGYRSIDEGFLEYLRHLALPAITLGLAYTGLIARMTRSSMLEVFRHDYVRTARAKGLRERAVIGRHVFRNALIPIVTIIGLTAGELLAGSVVTETVFNLPGIGRLVVDAVKRRDYPLIQGTLLVITLVYLVVNLIVDVLYAWVNPRIRY